MPAGRKFRPKHTMARVDSEERAGQAMPDKSAEQCYIQNKAKDQIQ
jgi:hypothetical protein